MSLRHAPQRTTATYAKLLIGASELFRASGVRATSIDEIVTATAVTKMTLYRYFSNKNDLVVACLREQGRLERLALTAVAEGEQPLPSSRLRAIGRYYAARFAARPRRGLFMLNLAVEYPDPDCPMNAVIQAEVESFQDHLALLIAPGQPRPQNAAARQLALAVFGASAGCQAVGVAACESLLQSIETLIAKADLPQIGVADLTKSSP